MALLLRLAGIPSIVAISHEYPGSLLDTRIPGDPDVHEVLRDLAVVEAAGFSLPPEDDGRLRIRPVVQRVDLDAQLPARYVVVHPGASVRARTWKIERWSAAIQALLAAGHDIVVTGCPSETAGLAPGVRETV